MHEVICDGDVCSLISFCVGEGAYDGGDDEGGVFLIELLFTMVMSGYHCASECFELCEAPSQGWTRVKTRTISLSSVWFSQVVDLISSVLRDIPPAPPTLPNFTRFVLFE